MTFFVIQKRKTNLARYQDAVCFKTFLRSEVVANKIMIRNIKFKKVQMEIIKI